MEISDILPNGFVWNEAELEAGHPLNDGLVTLALIGNDPSVTLIGTAFIVSSERSSCLAVSAAHCFEDIRDRLDPNKLYHPSTPREFLPAPSDVELKQVKAIYMKDRAAFFCDLDVAVWDVATDLAVFRIHAPEEQPDLFDTFFWLSDDIPAVGDPVAFIGFGEMRVTPGPEQLHSKQIERRLVVRVGLVEAIHPAGYYLLKGPCIEASVSIYSGMSGGAVARYRPDGNIEPFAFISHAPEPQPQLERDKSGHAMGSMLNPILQSIGDKKQAVGLRINQAGLGRNSERSGFDFPFSPDD